MHANIDRPSRKALASKGMIYMGGEEQEITVVNISIIGVLAELSVTQKEIDVKDIFNIFLTTTIIDLYLPDMRLAGEAEVVRVDVNDDRIFLALVFKNVAFDIDQNLNKRKAYRKSMPEPGTIELLGSNLDFTTVNVSAEGLMIRLAGAIEVADGTVTNFEFKKLDLNGKVQVVWSDITTNKETLMGLRYLNINAESIKGIPRFVTPNTSA